jgi:hypothetical protein
VGCVTLSILRLSVCREDRCPLGWVHSAILSICPSARPSVLPGACLPAWLCACLPVYLSERKSGCPSKVPRALQLLGCLSWVSGFRTFLDFASDLKSR